MKYVKPLNMFRDILKSKVLERGRLLGLDVGDRYVGLAVSDSKNKIASPLWSSIEVSEFNLKGFIVGYPSNRQQNTPDAMQVKLFIEELSKTGKLEGVEYTYWDECFTSKNVELFLKPLKKTLTQYEAKTFLDKFAAVGILQEYLDKVNRKVKLEANK
ncbi:hypothetical protein Patl1_17779 [Pistacia atlantica]|uniref:Uncharacterized protein n=1 Tax=Pistacia atlantica TaxID=434234 RepID=A0ACC1C1M0_9ROSI|nr:hypothetical protein Patl1_17779 [Pistacia atlantica]